VVAALRAIGLIAAFIVSFFAMPVFIIEYFNHAPVRDLVLIGFIALYSEVTWLCGTIREKLDGNLP
jgi:hypothetical protein